MFPGIDGFHWTVAHVVFLSLFFTVVVIILTTVVSAVWRTTRDLSTHRAFELCWKSDFGELPESDRRCRHELAGRVAARTCDNAFDCRHCFFGGGAGDFSGSREARVFGCGFDDDYFLSCSAVGVGGI